MNGHNVDFQILSWLNYSLGADSIYLEKTCYSALKGFLLFS